MAFTPERIAVIGATGPTGYWLIQELVARGRRVRAVSRNRGHLEQTYAGLPIDLQPADALDGQATRRALAGCDLVIDCIGLPANRMADHPRTAGVIADALRGGLARCLQVSSYWAYLPHDGEIIDESAPRRGGNSYMRARREAEDILRDAGAAIVHLPDFFGPRVHTSAVQNALSEALAGRPMNWLGRADVEREVGYVPDLMRLVADLCEHEEAFGRDWAFPGNGLLSADRLAAIVEAHLGHPVRVRMAPPWLVRLLSCFSADLRAIRPMLEHYASPISYDSSRTRELVGEVDMLPIDEAIRRTLDSLEAQSQVLPG